MIVANREVSLDKANEISIKIISLMTEEIKNYLCEDDPAEQIYLICHILGNLLAKIAISLDGYGKTYAIPNLSVDLILQWINLISDEYIKLNTNEEDKK